MITIEKLLLLKNVPLFSYTPEDILLEIAYEVKEKYVSTGELIIKEGDFGRVMYIIAEGKVKVHHDDIVVTELGKFDVFGELAALSAEVRTASVTAVENSVLLKIDHVTIYDMMARHFGLVKGIIEVLCHRMRAITDQ